MAAGGIHDHLGGGFARYATDTEWLVPHFEKMLYDQAGLLRAYLHGWQVTGNPTYLGVVEGIVTYVTRATSPRPRAGCTRPRTPTPRGSRGSSTSGPRTRWTRPSPTADVAGAVRAWFDVTPDGNFEGATILRRPVGGPLTGPEPVETGRRRLLTHRADRVRPGLDDKVLTEWNAMYAAALAEAAAAVGRTDWATAAVGIADFLWDHLRDADGRWLRSWQRGGGARHLAYAADHAWLVDCFTRMGELTGRSVWSERAVATADDLIARFADPDGGGFFTTATDAEQLIVRTKDIFDGATPSANAVAASALARLGALTGDAALHRARPGGGGPDRRPPHPPPDRLRPHRPDRRPAGPGRDRGGGDRRSARPGGRGPAPLAARRRGGLGEPTGSPLWADRAPGLAYVCRGYTCQVPAGGSRHARRPVGRVPAGGP